MLIRTLNLKDILDKLNSFQLVTFTPTFIKRSFTGFDAQEWVRTGRVELELQEETPEQFWKLEKVMVGVKSCLEMYLEWDEDSCFQKLDQLWNAFMETAYGLAYERLRLERNLEEKGSKYTSFLLKRCRLLIGHSVNEYNLSSSELRGALNLVQPSEQILVSVVDQTTETTIFLDVVRGELTPEQISFCADALVEGHQYEIIESSLTRVLEIPNQPMLLAKFKAGYWADLLCSRNGDFRYREQLEQTLEELAKQLPKYEKFIESAYALNINPLPLLRKRFPATPIVARGKNIPASHWYGIEVSSEGRCFLVTNFREAR